MSDVRDRATCTGCGACLKACKFGAMAMRRDDEGFLYPEIDDVRCTNCGACRRLCPVDRAAARPWRQAVAACAKDGAVREGSSSGGVFTPMARQVLANGGTVFGAAFAPDFTLRHAQADDETALAALRGSKYLQGDLGDAFAQVHAALDAGCEVLFSGTPCQVAGLYAHLGGAPDGLTTIDLVCHGTPSPTVFAAYLQEMQQRRGAKVTRFSFRDKQRGWKDFCVAAAFDDGTTYAAGQTEDPFMIAFLRNLCLRPSCHQCPFAGEKRQADLTLADLWGAQQVLPDWDDDRGLSMVLVGSEKGQALLDTVHADVRHTPVDPMACIRFNPSIVGPVPAHERRARFFAVFKKAGFSAALAAGLQPKTLIERAVGKARRVLKRILG